MSVSVRTVLCVFAVVAAFGCAVRAATLRDFTFAGSLQGVGFRTYEFPPPESPNSVLMRVELNVTNSPPPAPDGTPVPTNVQAIARDASQYELTSVSSTFGNADSSVAIVCPHEAPALYTGANQNYSLVVTGTVGSMFYVRVTFVTGQLASDNGTVVSSVRGDDLFKLFFFTLTEEQVPTSGGHSYTIEALSDTYDLAYLYIAPDEGRCVTRQAIDTASNTTARLTFSTTATFTLSRGSVPPIKPGRWFVAVVGRNLTESYVAPASEDALPTKREGTTTLKPFILRVASGFDYDFTTAICITLLVPFAISALLLISTHTWLYRTEWYYLYASRPVLDEQRLDAARQLAAACEASGFSYHPHGRGSSVGSSPLGTPAPLPPGTPSPFEAASPAKPVGQGAGPLSIVPPAPGTAPAPQRTASASPVSDFLSFSRLDGGGTEYHQVEEIKFDEPDHPSKHRQCTCAQFWSLIKYWVCGKSSRGYTFSWHALILACGFGVAGYQVVALQWRTQQLTGDRDTCAYNERCYHPHPDWDVPWNNIISNFPYMVLGLAFNIHCAMFQFERPEGDFSLFFALGWALIAEGAFSLFYHICPTTAIFQFDTAFMFVIAVLQLLAVYQTGEGDSLPMPRDRPYSNSSFKEAHVLMFCIIPLLVFNYLGALFDTEKYEVGSYIAYWVLVCIWESALFLYVGVQFKDPNEKPGKLPFLQQKWPNGGRYCSRMAYFGLYGFFVSWTVINAVFRYQKVAGMFLFKLLGISIFGLARVGPVKERLECGEMGECKPKLSIRCVSMTTLMLTFTSLFCIALWYFVAASTDKSIDAWASRALNTDCYDATGYFDEHDVWHILNHPPEPKPAAVERAQKAWAREIALDSHNSLPTTTSESAKNAAGKKHPSLIVAAKTGGLHQPFIATDQLLKSAVYRRLLAMSDFAVGAMRQVHINYKKMLDQLGPAPVINGAPVSPRTDVTRVPFERMSAMMGHGHGESMYNAHAHGDEKHPAGAAVAATAHPAVELVQFPQFPPPAAAAAAGAAGAPSLARVASMDDPLDVTSVTPPTARVSIHFSTPESIARAEADSRKE